jgi:hypothetical protein
MNHPSDNPDTCCPVCHGDGELSEEQVADVQAEAEALAALRRIVKRSLASGQLEKLEDARIYLEPADQPAPTETADRCRHVVQLADGDHRCMLPIHGSDVVHRLADPAPQGAHIDPIESGRPGKVAITNAPQGAPSIDLARCQSVICLNPQPQPVGARCGSCGALVR